MLVVTMKLQELLMFIPHLYKQWKLNSDLGSVANATEIVRSRDCAEHIHVYS